MSQTLDPATVAALLAGGRNGAVLPLPTVKGEGTSWVVQLTGTSGGDVFDPGVQIGASTMTGGAGNDVYYLHTGNDKVVEAAGGGTDTIITDVSCTLPNNVEILIAGQSDTDYLLIGNALSNVIAGNAGDNFLDGDVGNDTLFGGEGDDTLDGGVGADRITGGGGSDTFFIQKGNGSDVITDFESTIDLVRLGGYSFASFGALKAAMTQSGSNVVLKLGGSETLTFLNHKLADFVAGDFGFPDASSPSPAPVPAPAPSPASTPLSEALAGHSPAATVTNASKAWVANLTGSSGNDVLDAGTGIGASTMAGGAGDDVYYVHTGNDKVVEAAGGGTDTVITDIAYTLGDNVENLVASTKAGNVVLTGNTLDNVIVGGAGNDTLDGGPAGKDRLTGGGGSDTFVIHQKGAAGSDTITDFQAGVDQVKLQGFSFASFDALKAAMTQSGGNVVVTLGGGQTLTLQGHAVADFSARDFGFATPSAGGGSGSGGGGSTPPSAPAGTIVTAPSLEAASHPGEVVS
ncbi:MAG TPA: calcium-binding protein, partial [Stellaceae bacterium]